MTAPAFVTATDVRSYLGLNSVSSDSRYSDQTINSNIRAASWSLERATKRIFGDSTQTLKFTTNGGVYVGIPGLRTATTVNQQGVLQVVDTSYWLIPDMQQSGVYTGVQLRGFGSGSGGANWYLANPEWYDRNLDSWRYNAQYSYSLPNDLVIAGDWGYTDASMPEPIRHATKVLAAYYTKRPDAILSGALTTPDGNFVNLSTLPIEVQQFIAEWRVSDWVAAA